MSYSGNKAKILFGEYGLLTDIAPDKAPPESLIQAQNICFFNGAVQKAPGDLQWNATAVSSGIVGAHYYLPNTAEPKLQFRFVVVTKDGNIYKGRDRVFGNPIAQVGGTASLSHTIGLTPNVVFAEGGAEVATNPRKLFIFTGGSTLPYVINADNNTAATIALPASDWTSSQTYPKFGLIHRGSLWAFAGQIAYASNPSNHEDFQSSTVAFTEAVYPGEGGQLLGAGVYKGRLFAFKDGGYVYSLNDSDTSTRNWYWQKVASNFGLAAPNAVAEVLDDLLVGNSYGTLTSYAATQSLGNVEAADIMAGNGFDTFMRNQISKSGVPFEHLIYYSEKKMLFMTARSGYSTQNDTLMMLDFGRKGRVRAAQWTKGSPQCLAKYKDMNQVERPMYGDANGYLFLMDYADRLNGTAAYTGGFQTQHLDFSFVDPTLSSADKHFDSLAVHYIPDGSGTLSCDYFIDGRYIETLTFQMVQYKRPQLGTLTLDTDRLAQGNPETVTQPLKGTGKTLSMYFYNSGLNQSFQIPAVTVYFRGGGDKAQQV